MVQEHRKEREQEQVSPALKGGIDLDQIHLPDPVKDRLEEMTARLMQLEKCMERRIQGIACDECEEQNLPNCLLVPKEEIKNEDL